MPSGVRHYQIAAFAICAREGRPDRSASHQAVKQDHSGACMPCPPIVKVDGVRLG